MQDVRNWIQVAPQLNSQTYIHALKEKNGELYCCTGNGGRLFKWNGTNLWIQLAPQFGYEQIISDIEWYHNELYGISAYPYDGKLLKWNGVDAWELLSPYVYTANTISFTNDPLPVNDHIHDSASGFLTAGFRPGMLLGITGSALNNQYEAGVINLSANTMYINCLANEAAGNLVTLTYKGEDNERGMCLKVFQDRLFRGTQGSGELHRWSDILGWEVVAPNFAGNAYAIYDLEIFGGELYAVPCSGESGSVGGGYLVKWNGTDNWIQVTTNYITNYLVYALEVFDGELYAAGGNSSGGDLWQFDGVDQWVKVANFLGGQRGILSLKGLGGKLFGGTYPGGRLFEFNGTNAWVQVAAQLNAQGSIFSMEVLNGNLYAGTGDGGRLFITGWIFGEDETVVVDESFLSILTGGAHGLYWDWDELERSAFDYRAYRDTAGDDWSDWVMFPWQSYVVKVSRGTEPIDIEFCSDENQKFSYISLDEQGFIRLLAVRGFRTRNNVPGRNANYQVIVFR